MRHADTKSGEGREQRRMKHFTSFESGRVMAMFSQATERVEGQMR